VDAKERALKYVAIRMRSEWEMRVYLQKKGHTEEEIKEAIGYLYHYQYLDDAAFCRAYIRDKILLNPCGRNKLFADLRKKGVQSSIIKEAFAELFDKDTELEMAKKLLEKQIRLENDPIKQAQFLKNKGFSYGIISTLVDFE